MSVASRALTGVVRGYQRTISPLTGPRCKFHPTCSHFALEALEVHGAVVGAGLASWRILRCNPWSNGGVDDVPAKGERLFRLTRNNAAMLTEPTSVFTNEGHAVS